MVLVSTNVAMTYWERWRADAEARERARYRLPPKRELAKCKNETPSANASDTEERRVRQPIGMGSD
jgi:hypothetical protein